MCDLERYLFEKVGPSFRADGVLSAFDFFCIVIWKANRAKSKIAARLLTVSGQPSLETAVSALARSLYAAPGSRARFDVLFDDWGFQLPMASAILAVLYPDEFTVYDFRVCQALERFCLAGGMERVANLVSPESRWAGYQRYLSAVRAATPAAKDLRDSDKSLWGASFAVDLEEDLRTSFGVSR